MEKASDYSNDRRLDLKKSVRFVSYAVVTGESRMRIATVAVAAGEFVSIRPMRRGRD